MNFVEPTLNISLACSDSQEFPVDILDRHKLLDQLFELFETLSSSKASCSFALNGKWGSGKTFVIERLEHQLKQWRDGNKYLVFHYNCWQYDYYEEPLIAIVSAMQDDISDYTHVLGEKSMEKIKQVGHSIKTLAKIIAESYVISSIEGKISFDIKKLSASSKEGDYDTYSSLKKAMEKARNELSKLSADQTLVIVVDELDRCLPSYAIKVLERLHHLFSNLQNTVLMLAIDKSQLNSAIRHIFGEDANTSAYLKKFIDFEVPLDIGNVNERFVAKYNEYFSLFYFPDYLNLEDFEEYLIALFSGIDIRTQEHMIKRIQTIHQLLFKDARKDYAFMCFELFMVVLSTNKYSAKIPFVVDDGGTVILNVLDKLPQPIASYFRKHWNTSANSSDRQVDLSIIHRLCNIPEFIIEYANIIYTSEQENDVSIFGQRFKEFLQIKKMLDLIE